VIFGFTNDAFCFWNLYMMVYALLVKDLPWLQYGQYTHFTNSMHVYERHFEMIGNIVKNSGQPGAYIKYDVPRPTYQEALDLYTTQGKEGSGDYCTWLKT
jgi:thymidylate synthase